MEQSARSQDAASMSREPCDDCRNVASVGAMARPLPRVAATETVQVTAASSSGGDYTLAGGDPGGETRRADLRATPPDSHAASCPKYGGKVCRPEAGALCECYPGKKPELLIGYVIVEERADEFDIVLGTPLFEVDDRESAEVCAEPPAFVCEVRRV